MNAKFKIASVFSVLGVLVTLIIKFNTFYDNFIIEHLKMIERIDFFLAITIIFTTVYLFVWTLTNFVTKDELKKKCTDINRELKSDYITKDKLAQSLDKLHIEIKGEIASFKDTIKVQHDDTIKILNIIANQRGINTNL